MKPKQPRRFWSEEDLLQLAEVYPVRPTEEIARMLDRTLSGVYGAAEKLGLNKTPEFIASEESRARLQKGTRVGADYRFNKGHVPANKGLRRPGWHSGRMKETQFKKGQRTNTWKPVGTILADSAGYLRIKVRERLPEDAPGWNLDIWPLVHHQVWREHKGPIPPKHIVTFKDRNRSNCAFENLELLSMADNARRNAMWRRFPPDLIQVIQLNGVLKRKMRSINGQKHDGGPSGPPIRNDRSAEGPRKSHGR